MILELLSLLNRRRRYERISELITPIITAQSQQRVDRTLSEAYVKATAQGADPEEIKKFDQHLIDKINEKLSIENAKRIREWAETIIDQEERFQSGKAP